MLTERNFTESKIDRITHYNISVTVVKLRKDNHFNVLLAVL